MGHGERREILRSATQPRPDDGDELRLATIGDEIEGGDNGINERRKNVGARASRERRRPGRME